MLFLKLSYFKIHPRSSYIMSLPQVSCNNFATVSSVSFFGPTMNIPDVFMFKILDMW